jgi:hypothetical protein
VNFSVVAPATQANAGDVINYTLTASNTGNVTLTAVTIVDGKLGVLNCNLTQPATLLQGESLVCTGVYTLSASDVSSGFVTNSATAESDQTNPVSAIKTTLVNFISGQVRDDTDGDGNFGDADAGLANVRVDLYDGVCTVGMNCRYALTDSSGNYSIAGISNDSYVIVETDLVDYNSTADTNPPNDNQIFLSISNYASSSGNNFLDKIDPAFCVASNPSTGFVINTNPADGASGITLDTNTFTITFSGPMITSSAASVIDAGNYELKNQQNGAAVTILGVTYDARNHIATLTIDINDADWTAGAQYRLRVKNSIKSACGVGQGINVDHFFTTEMQITGQVRNDLDGDGNPADNDNGIYGTMVQLSDEVCTLGGSCRSTVTDLNGNFSFIGLTPGNYTLVETDLPGYSSTSDSDGGTVNQIAIALAAGTNSLGNFFLDKSSCVASDPVTGYVLSTTPANGATGISLGTTTLQVTFNQPMSTTGGGSVLDAGNFDNQIVNVSLGGNVAITNVSYNPNTKTATLTIDTTDADWKAGSQYRLRVKGGVSSACGTGQGINVDTLFYTDTQISGQVRWDLDSNSSLLDPDPGIANVHIELYNGVCTLGVNCPVTNTNAGGFFAFSALVPGSYVIYETDLNGYVSTADSYGVNDNQITVNLVAGTTSTNNIFLDMLVATATPTNIPIPTHTPTVTLTPIPTITQTPINTPTYTPTSAPAATWTPTTSQTPMPVSTNTLVPTYTTTFTPTP